MALSNAPSTQDAQVAGVGTTRTGKVIPIKDIESAEATRNNIEWLHELRNNMKLVKARFGVVVHWTLTEDLDLENANAQAIEKIMKDNDSNEQGPRIEKIAWLKKKDKALGDYASLGIWFDSTEGVDYVLGKGYLRYSSDKARKPDGNA
ncbi:uncharacterized protein KD926_009598 [Aspergillus affinis]|uniref:uncharacterized protein n=1 Tax=Aspergillus affinis TaxID=1070780 RepID=UPI0022FDFF17|nr:uncharacterized protein KD926_009598 [Aspergillus affinis]KAI9045184.1 hypothetical protein KD926_009598 [Aspergillus affinis]